MKLKHKLILTLTAFLLFPSFSWAMLHIDKTRIEISASPSEKKVEQIHISNKGDVDVLLTVSVSPYRHLYSSGTIVPSGHTSLPSCEHWIALESDTYDLPKDTDMVLPLMIEPDQHAQGEYVASIVIDQERKNASTDFNDQEGIHINVINRLAIPFYLFIKDTEKHKAEITDFQIRNSEDLNGADRHIFEVTLRNSGNIHIRTKGIITIFDQNSNVVQNIAIGETFPIFSNFSERISVYAQALEPGEYNAVATLNLNDSQVAQKELSFTI